MRRWVREQALMGRGKDWGRGVEHGIKGLVMYQSLLEAAQLAPIATGKG